MQQVSTEFSVPVATRATVARVQAIDIVRGLVMVIMALDHVRDFWSPTTYRPEDLAQTSVLLFFTRWITHFCAPTFVFLCLTLGAALVLLSSVETATNRLSQWLRTFGQVPFFYYILHLFLISFGALVWTTIAYNQTINLSSNPPTAWPSAYQPSLLRAYLVWVIVVLLLYLPCRWCKGFKQRHSYWWLSYV